MLSNPGPRGTFLSCSEVAKAEPLHGLPSLGVVRSAMPLRQEGPMENDTDRLPQIDEDSAEFADTIVLEDADIMETREFRQLVDPDAEPSDAEDQDDDS
jgi:hypothetical protein